jgi:predicted ribosomally synthesized peptide with nif11-like leader
MAVKNVPAFFEKVAENKALQAKLKALGAAHQKATENCLKKTNAALVKLAAAAGFKFTAKELTQVRGAKPRKSSRAELREVAAQMACGYGLTFNCDSPYPAYWG